MRHRGLIATWSVWALTYVALGLLFLADARGWRNALASTGPGPVDVGLHYISERLVWSLAFVLGAACVLTSILGLRRSGAPDRGSANGLCAITFLAAVTLSIIAVQSTPGRFNPPLDAENLTPFDPDQVSAAAGLLAFGAAAVVLAGMSTWVLLTRDRQRP